ncbi:ISL3 family transposase [Paenibacillus sp. MER TA 81-3]|uniref:ISL3 family transposase n=1 Tax=Paenibacillus sp. MER TA 81-3 TaxID=2939573 RepID=UPI00203C07E1|nr:ISL3 family transposase [Paenibacillus sp. MER TA 81-3]MCM3337774.1 ISL3 family transposase [Paenibacillus sp. MER TA 81-3]
MHNQYTDFLLRLPDVKTKQVLEINESTLHIEVTPIAVRQACPCCQLTEHVIRKGQNRVRRIRHLGVGGQKIYLLVPAIRLFCKSCDCGFVWNYSFVDPGKRYTKAFEQQALQTARVATVKQSAELHFLPNSTLHHKHEQWLAIESKRLQKQGWKEAASMSKLVLGIDDFAIRKGHTYNTGIHNLRGETLLDILPGRKLDELRIYAKQSPAFLALRPVAVVMDLAPYYHTWIRECFPEAIRVADRFHVQRYVVEAVQSIRKSITPTLAPQAKAHLKAKHRLLNPRVESLSVEKQEELRDILGYSALLKQAHAWKESFSRWYDYSPNEHTAKQWLHHWLVQGKQIQHPAIMLCLKTIKNWKTEILNYHRCRWTNAAVEGRNNRIKAFQRRHYFTRNRERYVQGLLVECNYAHYG